MNQEKIAICIRMAMARKGFTVTALAKVLGRSRTTVSEYAKGNCTDIRKLADIAEACGMTYEEMVALGA